GWWELNWANLNGHGPLRLSSDSAPEGGGQIWFPRGYYVGDPGSDRVFLTAWHQPPNVEASWSAKTWKAGDVVYNTTPAPGGWAGWICTTGGPNATSVWMGFGKIDKL